MRVIEVGDVESLGLRDQGLSRAGRVRRPARRPRDSAPRTRVVGGFLGRRGIPARPLCWRAGRLSSLLMLGLRVGPASTRSSWSPADRILLPRADRPARLRASSLRGAHPGPTASWRRINGSTSTISGGRDPCERPRSVVPALADLLPHRPPMLLLDLVLAHVPTGPSAGRRFARTRCSGSRRLVPAWAGLECMAQCVAVHAGLRARASAGRPPPMGLLTLAAWTSTAQAFRAAWSCVVAGTSGGETGSRLLRVGSTMRAQVASRRGRAQGVRARRCRGVWRGAPR